VATLTTPLYGLPYPDGAERVMDGDNAIGALAQAIETVVASHGIVLTGMVPLFHRASAPLTLGTVDVVIPGCQSAPLSVIGPETVLAFATVHYKCTAISPGYLLTQFYADGANPRPGSALALPAAVGEFTAAQLWTATAVNGQRLELRAKKSAAAGAATVEAGLNSTNLVAIRFRTTVTARELVGEIAEAAGLPQPDARPT